MKRLTLTLQDPEKIALQKLADEEFREPNQQAALIIRRALKRRGLLPAEAQQLDAKPCAKVEGAYQ